MKLKLFIDSLKSRQLWRYLIISYSTTLVFLLRQNLGIHPSIRMSKVIIVQTFVYQGFAPSLGE